MYLFWRKMCGSQPAMHDMHAVSFWVQFAQKKSNCCTTCRCIIDDTNKSGLRTRKDTHSIISFSSIILISNNSISRPQNCCTMPFEADSTPDRSHRTETMQVPNPKTMLEPPVVLIAGAGLGGLTAALLLETAGINYMVFERAAKLKPLGENPSSAKSVFCFGAFY